MNLGILFLHALPLDGTMWAGHMDMLPGSTYAPTLYGFGDTVEAWASGALGVTNNEKLIVVGCSIGGSCALEIALAAPERVAKLILIGTKAKHSPDPALHSTAIELIKKEGVEKAWFEFWEPLFSRSADPKVKNDARISAIHQRPGDIVRGVTAFHTRRSLKQIVPKIQSPIIVVSGREDIAPGEKKSVELAQTAARGSLHLIPSCGHYVPLENPKALRLILNKAIEGQHT